MPRLEVATHAELCRVYDEMFDGVESFEIDCIGAYGLYLLGGMLKGDTGISLAADDEEGMNALATLRGIFPPDDPVWQYIEILE